MNISFGGVQLPPTIDKNALAAAVALASDALAGAAEALAEAAQAMSDANYPDGGGAASGVPTSTVLHSHPPSKLEKKAIGPTPEGMSPETPNQGAKPDTLNRHTEPQLAALTNATPDVNASTPTRATPAESNPWAGSEATKRDMISTFLSLDYEPANSDSGNEAETNNQTWPGQVDENGPADQPSPSEYERGIYFTMPRPPSVASDSGTEVNLIPLLASTDLASDTVAPRGGKRINMFGASTSPKSELNNKRNASPLRATTSSNMRDDTQILKEQTFPPNSHSSPEPSKTREVSPNRHFIRLAQPSDAISFIAYISQKVNNILCVTPDLGTARSASDQLENLKQVSVYRVYTTGLVKAIRQKFQIYSDSAPPIAVFMPLDILNGAPNKNLGASCVLHWGPPPDAQQYILETLALSPTPRISCVMVIGNRGFNESAYGVSPFPDSELDAYLKYCAGLRSAPLLRPPRQSAPNVPHPHAKLLQNAATIMKSHPAIPPGRNYIQLNQASDAFAFVAYMVLQANQIICLAPNQFTNTCSEVLKSLTRARIHRVTTVNELQRIYQTIQSGSVAGLCNILVASSDLLNVISLRSMHFDCVVHWGQPPNGTLFIDKALAFLSPTARACVVMLGEQNFNGATYGIRPYSDEVLDTFINPQSPFQMLRQLSSQLLSGSKQPTWSEPGISGFRPGLLPPRTSSSPAPVIPSVQAQHSYPLPSGHYYIVLDETRDIDLVPIIILITQNTKKVLCRIPPDRSTHRYQSYMMGADLNALVSTSPDHSAEKIAMNKLKSAERGILLRNKVTDWHAYWSKGVVDCLIFCEVPGKALKKHYSNCREKVTHSYLILSQAEYSKLPPSDVMNQAIMEHPHIKFSEYARLGSPLYDLRQRLLPHISG